MAFRSDAEEVGDEEDLDETPGTLAVPGLEREHAGDKLALPVSLGVPTAAIRKP